MTRLRCDVLVYGGGVAALAAARALAEAGLAVELVGPIDAARWPTFAVGGIDCADDSEAAFVDAIVGGDFLAERAPVRAMMRRAPEIIDDLERIGVPFAREGSKRRLRRLDGMRAPRGVFVEARTTRAVLDALDDQVTRLGVRRREHHSLEALVADANDRFAGAVVQDRVSMELATIEARALVLALGGAELSLASSPTAVATESALAVALDAGALLANMELLQTVPTAIWLGPRVPNSPRGRRALVPSSALVGEGATVWLPREPRESRLGRDVPSSDRRAFLELAHPGWGTRLPSDLATRLVRTEVLARGLYDRRRDKHQPLAYLDVSHLPERHARERLGSELDLYGKLSGVDPYRGPLPVHPALADRLGGLWVDFDATPEGDVRTDSPRNHATTLEGVYACGGAAHLYHGANRLSGNLLLADVFGATVAAGAVRAYHAGVEVADANANFTMAVTTVEAAYEEIGRRTNGESVVALHAKLRETLHRRASFVRDRAGLEALKEELEDLTQAVGKATPRDDADIANRGIALARDLEHAVLLATVTGHAALARRESRGVHHRSDHDDRPSLGGAGSRRPKPRLTLVRRDDMGSLRLEDHARYRLLGQAHERPAAIDEGGIDDTTHPRHYAEGA